MSLEAQSLVEYLKKKLLTLWFPDQLPRVCRATQLQKHSTSMSRRLGLLYLSKSWRLWLWLMVGHWLFPVIISLRVLHAVECIVQVIPINALLSHGFCVLWPTDDDQISVKVDESGWAWMVCGERLIIWKICQTAVAKVQSVGHTVAKRFETEHKMSPPYWASPGRTLPLCVTPFQHWIHNPGW